MKDQDWTKLTDRERDAMVAEAFGVRFWLEQRGEYRLAVTSLRDGREPWKQSQNGTNERYTQVTGAEAVAAGFFGKGPDEYTTTWPGFGLVVEAMRAKGWVLTLKSDIHMLGWQAVWEQISSHQGRNRHEAYATSAPAATTLAAIRAIQGEQNV